MIAELKQSTRFVGMDDEMKILAWQVTVKV